MGDVLPLYNGENDVSYTLPTGLDFLSNNNNLLKMAIPDMLQRPGNAAYATCQSLQLNQPVGITTKVASWSMNPQANNYGGALNDGGSAHASLAAASLLAGRNAPDLLKNAFSAYRDPTSTMVSFLSPRMPGHNLHHQMNEDQGRSFNDSNFGPRSANMHALLPNLSASPPLQEPFFPSQDFGQNHGWKNSGTELLLLPGSNEALSRNLPHNVASLSSYQSALPFAQCERSERMASAKDEVSLYKDCLQIGRHGQVLSLSLSNSHQQTHSNLHSFDMGISASGSICIIRNSKYLRPAQQLLDEFCNVGKKLKKTYSDRGRLETTTTETGNEIQHSNHKTELSRMEREAPAVMEKRGGAPSCPIQERTDPDLPTDSDLPPLMMHPDERSQLQLKKARLVAMVEEVDKAYRQYQEQMQMVITSFESAAGLGGAAPYTVLARQAMSRHFRLLRDAISDQIHVVCKALGEEASSTVPVLCRGETPRLRILDQQLRNQRALQQTGLLQQQPWRPQRGLPERSVSILRAWLFEHFLDPYPKDSEKLMLARQTGLNRNQVSNWFINARVRLWKPMIEDMYREEAKEAEKHAASAGVNSMAGMRDRDNKKEQIRDEKQPVDVVSCSLTQQEGDQASAPNSSGSCEYASEARLHGHGEELNNFENVKGDSGEKQKGGMNVGHGGGQIIGAGVNAHIQSKGITGYPENILYGGRNKAGSGVTLTLGLHQSSNGMCISGADYEHAQTYYHQQQQSFPSSNILYRGGDQSSSSYNDIRSTQHYGR